MASRIILQLAEDLVTELLVERKGLKIVGIAMRVRTPAAPRLLFRGVHETSAKSMSPKIICNPKLLDEQPVPVRITEKTADDLSRPTRDHGQSAVVRGRGLRNVVADQLANNLLRFASGERRLHFNGDLRSH